MTYSLKLLKYFLLFTQNLLGVINSPYRAFRRISQTEELGQLIFIFLLVAFYFAFGTSIRLGVGNPYLLSGEFNKLFSFAILTFLLFSTLIYTLGTIFGGKGRIKSVLLGWSYTLLPTLVWFFITSLIYILFPPPRTLSFPGKALSLVFIAFSLGMLFWKVVLYYLTLRFTLKLDLLRILGVSTVLAPVIAIYGIIMYRLGIYRIPFI